MATIETEHLATWFDLTLRLDDYFAHYNNYIFRGQADATWPLDSTLKRAIHRNYPNEPERLRSWKSVLSSFRANIRGRCPLDLESSSDDELWALGQHYGLYTPLLDWTRSPYVGLFFALQGACSSGNRALWAFAEGAEELLHQPKVPSRKIDRVRIVEPLTHHNARLVSQRGLFLSIPPTQSLEKLVGDITGEDFVVMYKFTFPDSIRSDALAALDLRNINHASLFPDIQGSALHTNYEYDIEDHLNKMKKSGWNDA